MTATTCDLEKMDALVRAGSPAALEQILCCHGEDLLRLGRCRCRSEQEARDAVQDALLSAGEHLHDYRGDGSLAAWLGRMVTHACYRMQRGRKNNPALHTAPVEAVLPAAAPDSDPEAVAARQEAGVQIERALAGLAPLDQEIVRRALVEEQTAADIAAQVDLSPEAVRARLSRARRRLRQALLAEGISPQAVTPLGHGGSVR